MTWWHHQEWCHCWVIMIVTNEERVHSCPGKREPRLHTALQVSLLEDFRTPHALSQWVRTSCCISRTSTSCVFCKVFYVSFLYVCKFLWKRKEEQQLPSLPLYRLHPNVFVHPWCFLYVSCLFPCLSWFSSWRDFALLHFVRACMSPTLSSLPLNSDIETPACALVGVRKTIFLSSCVQSFGRSTKLCCARLVHDI